MNGVEQHYKVESKVWGFYPGHSNRVAGYLMIEQKVDVLAPRNYAISHCELDSYKKECSMKITSTLNGAGSSVVCKIPKLKKP